MNTWGSGVLEDGEDTDYVTKLCRWSGGVRKFKKPVHKNVYIAVNIEKR